MYHPAQETPLHRENWTPSKLKIKFQGEDDKVETAEVLPVRGNCVLNMDTFVQVLEEVLPGRACQLGKLELYQNPTKSPPPQICCSAAEVVTSPVHFGM